jgi:hypothetical protein
MSLSKLRFKRRRTDAAQREQLLAAFERSGLSAAEFARLQGLNYTTFCGWRQRRGHTTTPPAFVQVELATPVAPVELVIEVGPLIRLRLQSEDQIALAAKLLHHLNSVRPC